MRHTLPLALLLLLACGDSDPAGDAGNVSVDCEQALRDNLPSGSPCDFDDICTQECGTQLSCVDGELSIAIGACDGGLDGGTDATDGGLDDADVGADAGDVDSGVDAGEVPLCSDYRPPPPVDPACASDEMCLGGRSCARQHDRRCGICIALERTCEDDTGCEGTDVCVETTHPCACDGPGTQCEAACSGDSCGDGFICGSDGHCIALSCTEGYECDPNFDCVFGGVSADAHGCARRGCSATSDCECGACVGGECSSGPGSCRLPAP